MRNRAKESGASVRNRAAPMCASVRNRARTATTTGLGPCLRKGGGVTGLFMDKRLEPTNMGPHTYVRRVVHRRNVPSQ